MAILWRMPTKTLDWLLFSLHGAQGVASSNRVVPTIYISNDLGESYVKKAAGQRVFATKVRPSKACLNPAFPALVRLGLWRVCGKFPQP